MSFFARQYNEFFTQSAQTVQRLLKNQTIILDTFLNFVSDMLECYKTFEPLKNVPLYAHLYVINAQNDNISSNSAYNTGQFF